MVDNVGLIQAVDDAKTKADEVAEKLGEIDRSFKI